MWIIFDNVLDEYREKYENLSSMRYFSEIETLVITFKISEYIFIDYELKVDIGYYVNNDNGNCQYDLMNYLNSDNDGENYYIESEQYGILDIKRKLIRLN